MKKICLISLGCAKNLVDSEVMLGYLKEAGYRVVTSLKKTDILVINTCGFIKPAKKESETAIRNAVDLKKKGFIKKIIAVGCFIERCKLSLVNKFPEIDTFLGVNEINKIVSAVEGKPFVRPSSSFLYTHTSPRLISTPLIWTYVKISEGCSHKCSFCTIPLIKGKYRSREISSIVQEVEKLTLRGVKEINLVSQDSTYFGQDRGDREGLTRLLKSLIKIKSLKWIRVLYGHPEEISDSLLDVLQEEKICSYLDIPFQHADPEIIKRMKRRLNGENALKLLQKIRAKIPEVALRTSLVVGFPGEGKKEFQALANFVKEARFDHLGVFSYSHEEGIGCFDLGDPVKPATKKYRIKKIMEIQADISYQTNKKYLNKQLEVLIEGCLKKPSDFLVARSRFQAPEVDGKIFIEPKGISSENIYRIQRVEITERDVYDLYGKSIE
ncbi:30S ribosomal protein S12 methylthiotransferase RimO [Acidobacteriota bacterium]